MTAARWPWDVLGIEPTDDTPMLIWDNDEPSLRGIEGPERMRLIRDDITDRVRTLLDV